MARPVDPKILGDRLIERSLTVKAGKIEPPPGMASRVSQALRTDLAHRRTLVARIPVGKRSATAAAGLVLAGSTVFMTSPGMQAWAATQANQLINTVQVTLSIKHKHGHEEVSMMSAVKAPAGGNPVSYQTQARPTTIAQAERTVGFHIEVPSYLPAGYQLPSMVSMGIIGKSEGQNGKFLSTGKYELNLTFNRGQDGLPGLSLDISQIAIPQPRQFQYTSVQVNGQSGKWFDNELAVHNTSTGRQQTVTEHILSWMKGGLQYTLTDYSGLPMAEMVKIAESLK